MSNKKNSTTPISRSGVAITDELADELADEAEHGYELEQGKIVHTGRGRPSLSGRQTSPQVTFRIPAKLREQADKRAADEHKTVSELAREALERYLAV